MAFRSLGSKEKIFGNALENIERFLRIGKIIRVDSVHMTVDIQWMSPFGSRTQVPILSALTTPRAGIIGMPEVGSLVICGWLKQTNNTGKPVILGYLPCGLLDANKYNLMQPFKIEKKYRLKRRPIYPGEIYLYSTQGSEILLDGSIYITNKNLNELILRDRDQAIIQNSLQRYTQCEGIFKWEGKIERLQARSKDDDPSIEVEPIVEPYQFRDGKRAFYVTHDNSATSLVDDGIPYIEDRYELLEDGEGRLIASEFNVDKNIERIEELPMQSEYKGPMIQIIRGTVVGNDPYSKMEEVTNRNGFPYADKIDLYSYPIKPKIYEYWDAIPFKMPMEINISDEQTGGEDEELKLSSMYRLNFPQCKDRVGDDREPTKIDINKYGKIFINIGRSGDLDPLGKWRSAEVSATGSIKLGIGRNNDQHQSLIINTEGGVALFVEGYDLDPSHMHYGSEGNGIALNTLLLTGCENFEMHGGDSKNVIKGGNYYLETRKAPGDLSGLSVTTENGTKEGRIHLLSEDQIRVRSETESIYIKAEKDIIFEAGGNISFDCKENFIVQCGKNMTLKVLAKFVLDVVANITFRTAASLFNKVATNFENLIGGAISFEAAYDIYTKAEGAIISSCKGSLGLKTEDSVYLQALKKINVKADEDIYETAGVNHETKASGDIIEEAATIHMNGPAATEAEPSEDAEGAKDGEAGDPPLIAEIPEPPF